MSDFFLPVVLSAPADNAMVAAFQAVMNKAQDSAPWLPPLAGESAGIFYGSPPSFPRLNPSPDGLDDSQQEQWTLIYRAVAPIASAAMRGEMQTAQAQGAQLASDAAFWNTVHRITLDVATLGANEAWIAFWDAIAAAKEARDGIVASLRAAEEILASQGNQADPSLLGQQQNLRNQLDSLINQILSVISPLGNDVRQQAGLGVAPLVVAGIAAAVVTTITASVWAIAHELSAVQQQANEHAQAVLDHQTAVDEAALAAGQIDQNEFARRRAATAQQAKDIADAQGAGAVGSGLAKAGLGVALVIGAVAAGIFFLKKKSAAAPVPATNPRRRR